MFFPHSGKEPAPPAAGSFAGLPVWLCLLPALSVGCDPQNDVIATTDGVCKVGTLGYGGAFGAGNVFTGWLATAHGAASLEASVLTDTLLAPFEVIVVQDVRVGSPGKAGIRLGIGREYSADEVEVLSQWVAKGGGLMTLTAYSDPSEIANVNRLLAPHGLSYDGTQVLPGSGAGSAPVTHWADHPLTRGVSRVGVNNAYPVQGGGTLIAWEPIVGRYDLGRAVESGSGHVFAWGDEWVTYDSEWNQHPENQFAQFWVNALTWLSRTAQCQLALPSPE